MGRIRIAVVGTGNIARFHVAAVRERRDEAEVVAAADVDGDRAAAFCAGHGIPASYTSLAKLLEAERPDLVHLCTPPGAHAEQAVRCLDAGVSVLCEKPPCLSLADFDRIVAAERRGGAHFVTVFQHRFASSGRRVKALIDAGELGRPLVAVCNTLWYRDQRYFDPPWRGRWETEGGGPTMGHGIHQLDLLSYLLGEWSELWAVAGRLEREIETEDVSLAHVRFASGALATVVNSVLSPRQETYLRLDLSAATVELTHLYGYGAPNWRLTPAPRTPPERVERWRLPEPDRPSGHAAQIAEVIGRLRRGQPPEPASASVRTTMELVTGLYAAAFSGRGVRREELTPASPFYGALHGGDPDRFRDGRQPRGTPVTPATPGVDASIAPLVPSGMGVPAATRPGVATAPAGAANGAPGAPGTAGTPGGAAAPGGAAGELDLRADPAGGAVSLVVRGIELFRYVHSPGDPQVESPRPYLHPVRTLDGDVVTAYRPHDHPWHKGISLALPNVGEANFWGGVTFRRGLGYTKLPNNGSQRHVGFDTLDCDGRVARVVERLHWITEQGETWIEEARSLAAALLEPERAWVLAFRTVLTNVSGSAIGIGSPTTEGLPLAGYGGLFWRGPRSFGGGEVIGPDTGGEGMMGRRAGWLAFAGRHDEVDRASTLVFVDHPANPGHPTEWFVRSRPYACACPAPFFSRETSLAAGDRLTLGYHVVVAAGAWDRERAARVVRERVARLGLLPPGAWTPGAWTGARTRVPG